MEDALRDGLAGISGTEDLEATHHLPDDEATRMLATGSRPRRPLQPLAEDPPSRRMATRPAPSRRQPAPQRQKSGGAGKWVALLLVIILIAAGAIAYQAMNGGGTQQVELKSDVRGNVDDAVQSFKDLVENNTR
jgi:serine/threonine-protein kinase